ncbi:MAG: cysteine desulfurase [Gemmataceae bacterium]|nr:cysteine desulfurase [Gemmataceae bacterium]
MEPINLDNNATTPLLPTVWEAMTPYFTQVHGNPASPHAFGRKARQALEDARECVAERLDAHADEVVFTSGATEANNTALLGLTGDPPGHVIASPIEHPSVAEPVRHLASLGCAVDWLDVDATGIVSAESLHPRVRADTRLIAIQLANHETGAVQPIRPLAGSLPWIAFHCDAVQAAGKLPVRFHELGVTTLVISAHKFHGPKGIGALLIKRGVKLRPMFRGGHQQQGRRPGTEPVALAVGLARALELAHREADTRRDRVQRLRRLFLEQLQAAAPIILNGPAEGGVPHTLNLAFPGCLSESLLMNLDLAGVACSTGSACSSGSLLPSPVLQAMGVPVEALRSAVRFSLSCLLTDAEIVSAGRRIADVVRRLRAGGEA